MIPPDSHIILGGSMRRHHAAITAAALCAALALTGTACSSDGTDTDTDTDTDTEQNSDTSDEGNSDASAAEAELIADINEYIGTMFEPDVEAAYAMMSARCRDQYTLDEYRVTTEELATNFGQLAAEDIVIDDLSGDLARASYTVGGLPAFEREAQPWVREEGQWRYDGC
jgi:hypothetical protein